MITDVVITVPGLFRSRIVVVTIVGTDLMTNVLLGTSRTPVDVHIIFTFFIGITFLLVVESNFSWLPAMR
jgi:hypothetical protein